MPSPLCHFELMTNDLETCREFYGSVFDWSFDNATIPGYTLINAGSEPTGAIFSKPEDVPTPCVNVYFQVQDIEATIGRIREHGGTILVPKTQIPNVGHFAIFSDPDGMAVGIMQPAS